MGKTVDISWTETREVSLQLDELVSVYMRFKPEVLADAIADDLESNAAYNVSKYAPVLAELRRMASDEDTDTITDINDVEAKVTDTE